MTKMAKEMSQTAPQDGGEFDFHTVNRSDLNVQLTEAAEYFGATVSGNLATEPFSQTDHHLR
jgi:hypothetical protein